MAIASKRASSLTREAVLHEADFYTWAIEQAALLRAGTLERVDVHHLAEEIEALGNEQLSKLRSCYRLIAMHLLELLFQPDMATRSWRVTIVRERSNIDDILGDNPGLKPRRKSLFAKAYAAARKEAAAETGLPLQTFPTEAPFTLDEVEDEAFWPGM